jgi:peptidoglycan/LPS O-acetylase OafA/YrhL
MGFLSGGLFLLRADASYVAGQQMAIVQGLNSRARRLMRRHAGLKDRIDCGGWPCRIVSGSMDKIREIDGLRAIAILLVVAWHYLGAPDGPQALPWRLFIFGRSGVDLFFVLSGYLITSILLNNRSSPRYFSAFYGRRAFRILPVYTVMLIVFFAGKLSGVGHTLFDGALPWWSYALGIQNIFMSIHQSYGAIWLNGTWSLAIEEQFYLLFPLIVLWLPRAWLPRFLVAMLIVSPLGRIVSYATGDRFSYYVLTPFRADILAIGGLIACSRFSGPVPDRLRRFAKTTFAVTICAAPLFAFLVGQDSDFHMALWGHTYLVALFGSTVFMVLENRNSASLAILRSRAAEFFARISYALYLVHVNVLIFVFWMFGTHPTIKTIQGVALTALALAASALICFISYRYIEGPLIRMGHRKFRFDGSSSSTVAKSQTAAAA